MYPYIKGRKSHIGKQVHNITLYFRPLVLETVSKQFISIQEKT